ncbi:imelysin family protein [Microbaculum marinisediminis]|uniref:Peptidase n=1 Tax=Microbaculum marinisediminis TaxID=2931392 RepID=A0AAW5QWA8_9HYPH|nr:imelysin family protein [Microbaculum sp. A6E488]MCT8970741.1 peptidase [Microbaculum sp. A6E488]
MMRNALTTLAAGGLALMTALPATAAEPVDVLESYADIALAGYEDSLETARSLNAAVRTLVAEPSAETLAAARTAWLAARVPYLQTEAFRFGNAIVDDWEGRVNAWPLDEGLIDYVDASYGTESDTNGYFLANIIANPTIRIGGQEIDAREITPELLSGTLQEIGGVEANVATGYHAIEFLLWGQDLNGTDAGAGNRPHTDFDTASCTGGNCDRRGDYLVAAADLLVDDLEEMVANWDEDGEARGNLIGADPQLGLIAILTGLGSLSYGELAGERMKLGLLLNDPEEEQDCFSDNTHNAHYYDQLGIANVYLGRYKRIDGSTVTGASMSDLVKASDAALDEEMRARLDVTTAAMEALRARGEAGEAYDQMIGEGNAEGNAVVQAAIDGLVDQTRTIERIVASLGLQGVSIEGSDSLDEPDAVFQ